MDGFALPPWARLSIHVPGALSSTQRWLQKSPPPPRPGHQTFLSSGLSTPADRPGVPSPIFNQTKPSPHSHFLFRVLFHVSVALTAQLLETVTYTHYLPFFCSQLGFYFSVILQNFSCQVQKGLPNLEIQTQFPVPSKLTSQQCSSQKALLKPTLSSAGALLREALSGLGFQNTAPAWRLLSLFDPPAQVPQLADV